MAKMTFAVSEKEFAEKVKYLRSRLPKRTKDPIGSMIDFFHSFMINMKNESMLGYYDYELQVGNQSISLDVLDMDMRLDKDRELRELIEKVLAS